MISVAFTPSLIYNGLMKRNSLGRYIKVDPKERFWDKVDKTPFCWNWLGKKRKDGYGLIWVNNKPFRAHRFVMGVYDPSIKILHKCDNPSCVRPSHLLKGTQFDNIQDMLRKNRNSYFGNKGSSHPKAKLTTSQISEIRKKYVPRKYSAKQLALEYNVSQQTISRIILKQRYG